MNQEEIEKMNKNMEPFLKELNQALAEEFRSPNYRYFTDKKGNRYFWTTEPITKDGKKRFISGVYKCRKDPKVKQFKLTKQIYHAKRYKAKERALKLLNKTNEKNEQNI
jgi:hypothetical protein